MIDINDLVVINVDNKPGFYARIEEITPDVKPNWWQVRILALTFPAQVFTWILDEYQLNGADFTIGGTPLRIDPLPSLPVEEEQQEKSREKSGQKKCDEAVEKPADGMKESKVVSLLERRRK